MTKNQVYLEQNIIKIYALRIQQNINERQAIKSSHMCSFYFLKKAATIESDLTRD